MLKDDIAAASRLGLTHGAYISNKDHYSHIPSIQAKPKVIRCHGCGARVSQLEGTKLYCPSCSKQRHDDEARHNSELYRRSYKTDRQKREG